MGHVLEADERLFSSEYWGEVDIANDASFDVPSRPRVQLSVQEQKAANQVLASCAVEIYRGDFVETDYRTEGDFRPSEEELADGTVLIVDREHLMRWRYGAENDRQWPEADEPTSTRLPGNNFAELWNRHQPATTDELPFSEEGASFPNEKIIYSRVLEWGVLVTKDGQRALSTMSLSAVKVFDTGLFVPHTHDDEIFRGADSLPLPFKRTAASPDLNLADLDIALGKKNPSDTFIREMSRVRGIKVIHAATAEYDPAGKSAKFSKRFKDALGGLVLPKPDVEPEPSLRPI